MGDGADNLHLFGQGKSPVEPDLDMVGAIVIFTGVTEVHSLQHVGLNNQLPRTQGYLRAQGKLQKSAIRFGRISVIDGRR